MTNLLAGDATWRQVEEYLKSRNDVIIPIGSTEEHGHHLPLLTDAIIAWEIAKELSKRLEILVMPPINYGICRHTAPYPGTTSVEFDSLKGFVRDILDDMYGKGFRAFYLLTGHAGSVHKVALREAGRALTAKGAGVYLIDPYEISIADLLESGEAPPGQFTGHADEAETSLMLYLRPELVDMKKSVDHLPRLEMFEVTAEGRPTESGVFGKPSLASREKGERIFKRMVDEIAELIESRRARSGP